MSLSIELAPESINETCETIPRFLRWVIFDNHLKPQAKYIFTLLYALFENPEWKPCYEGLATMAGKSPSTVKGWAAKLRALGHLRIRPVQDRHGVIRLHEWTLFAVPGDESQSITRRAPTLLGLVAGTTNADGEERTHRLYAVYADWAKDRNQNPVSLKAFSLMLDEHGIAKRRVGGGMVRTGVSLICSGGWWLCPV